MKNSTLDASSSSAAADDDDVDVIDSNVIVIRVLLFPTDHTCSTALFLHIIRQLL